MPRLTLLVPVIPGACPILTGTAHDETQSMTGWELRSDPDQVFDLPRIGYPAADGKLDGGESISLGPAALPQARCNVLWSERHNGRQLDQVRQTPDH